jgi:peptidoglycan/LPS O-acetylase OafA/YrhL
MIIFPSNGLAPLPSAAYHKSAYYQDGIVAPPARNFGAANVNENQIAGLDLGNLNIMNLLLIGVVAYFVYKMVIKPQRAKLSERSAKRAQAKARIAQAKADLRAI